MWQSESWLISLNCRLKLFILHFYVYEVWSKNNSYFIFFFKKYLFINTHLVSFKVTSLRYNTLMPAFFFQFSKHFWNPLFDIANEPLFRFFLYLLNHSKTLSFHRCLQFWEEEKVSGCQVQWIRWLRHDYGSVFGQKLTHKHRCVSWCVIMLQNPWLVFPQFCAFLTNCLAQSAHTFKVVFLFDRTTLWQEFMMHHAIAIEENSEQNLHIWPNLICFFRSWLFFTLLLGWSSVMIFLCKSELSLNVVNISWAMDVVFVKNLAILVQS